jgi:prepilin-type N-terminal cleavage/methylation domain-containing protein
VIPTRAPAAEGIVAMPAQPSARAGFTLIELLMVFTVIAILMGLLMPMYSIVNSWTRKARTQFVLKKTDTALRLFKADFGVYPYVRSYPATGQDLLGSDPNRLYYRIGRDIDPADAVLVRRDMATASAKFGYAWMNKYPWSPNPVVWGSYLVESPSQPSAINFRQATCVQAYYDRFAGENYIGADIAGYATTQPGVPIMLNRMAQERVRLAVLAGDVDVRGPIVCTRNDLGVTVDHTGSRVLDAPESAARPGWAKDYLQGEIDRSNVKGDAILDGWKRPLVYICQCTPGVVGDGGRVGRSTIVYFDSRFFGLGPAGFNPATGPGPALLASRPLLLTSGRVRLSASDAGDGHGPTPTDPTWFPDAARLMGSDVRYYAAPGYETEFELWSAGRDGRFDYLRDGRDNADNLSVTPYTKGLQ